MADKQAEVKKRQDAEKQAAEAEAQLNTLKNPAKPADGHGIPQTAG